MKNYKLTVETENFKQKLSIDDSTEHANVPSLTAATANGSTVADTIVHVGKLRANWKHFQPRIGITTNLLI